MRICKAAVMGSLKVLICGIVTVCNVEYFFQMSPAEFEFCSLGCEESVSG